ncbi:hypothetical protein ACFS2C_01220 [Prauserella oleivorans]|uniref:Secreted protein n=1 Tax=Prauserella oleivorans TaxID=1478153 RepID=A0ABW5W716_9PSEU
MLYLLAAIGALTIAVLLWRVLGAERVGVATRQAPIAPDDDPEFLRKLGEQSKKPSDDDDKS